MKYFEDESIPEFVREAKIKKKFTSVCDTLCTLFADYHDKPSKRVYLIGYIAMIHKDMGLTLQDLNDFMSDLTEALMIELPDIMTVEHENAQNKYFSMLAETLLKFMEEQDEKQDQLLRSGHGMKKVFFILRSRYRNSIETRTKLCRQCFPWNVEPEMRLMYGYPLKYWLHKKQYWEYRRAIWASLEADLMANSMTATWTVGGRTGERRRRRRVKRRISAKRIRRRMESKKTASSNSDGTDNRTGKRMKLIKLVA
ncbi:uncharacterized protein LOC113463807 isoform X1 [Ceratina calcarata]|uniref:Uncharacterized protein LOC113463807 isoform X1 n=1 Tax=Ceratina calcarata TaxID=156304 RepID=A0AAJ7S0B6_9HYME|nr:uncharacterized protein LOC113463807 isoform X1 [Ceratina calcarata]